MHLARRSLNYVIDFLGSIYRELQTKELEL